MYPVTLIRVSKNRPITVELKNNDIYEGIIRDCDLLMNIHMTNVRIKSNSGNFYTDDCVLKGMFIKNIRLSDNVFDIQKRLEKQKGKIQR